MGIATFRIGGAGEPDPHCDPGYFQLTRGFDQADSDALVADHSAGHGDDGHALRFRAR